MYVLCELYKIVRLNLGICVVYKTYNILYTADCSEMHFTIYHVNIEYELKSILNLMSAWVGYAGILFYVEHTLREQWYTNK